MIMKMKINFMMMIMTVIIPLNIFDEGIDGVKNHGEYIGY